MIGYIKKRLSNSFAFRSGTLYRQLLKTLPSPRLPKKQLLQIPLLTMCGRKHLLMLEQALFTIATNWTSIPNIVVVSDGTASMAEISKKLHWWPAQLKVVDWQRFRDFHSTKSRFELVEYANRNAFGRKLSAILAMAEETRLLWCDCDILFYSDFTRFINIDPDKNPFVAAAKDWIYGYDTFLTNSKLKHLLQSPPVSTGVALCEGNLHDACHLSEIIREAIPNCMPFTEQTILAEAVFQAGKIAWGLEVIKLFDDDKFSIKPTYLGKNWVARHYTNNMRHLFWRDALAVRLGMQFPRPAVSL